jgi:hypothetical protein
MAGGSVISSLAAAFLLGTGIAREILFGMAGPLVAASVAWVMMERTYRRDPGQLTALMLKAFAGKMLFFAAYVVIALKVVKVRPVPFVASFTSYFIVLHLMEAVCFRRMFAERSPSA